MTKKKRKWIWWMGGVVIALFLFVALLPTIASTGLGRNIAVGVVNRNIGGKVGLESWDLSWFGGQELKGLSLTDPDGELVLAVPEVTTDTSIVQLISGGRGIGATIVKRPVIELRSDATGQSSLERALFQPGTRKASRSPALFAFPLLAGQIQIQDGAIHIIAPDGNRTTIAPLNFEMSIPKEADAISMKVSSNDIVGDLSLTGLKHGKLTLDGGLPEGAELVAHLRATHFPLALLDVALAYQSPENLGILTESLGSTALIKVDAYATRGRPTHLTVEAAAKNGSLRLNGQIDDLVLTLNQPLEARLQVTPEVGRLLLGSVNPLLSSALRSERPIVLTISPENFCLPLYPFKLDKIEVGQATVDWGKLWLANTGQVKELIDLFPKSQLVPEPEILAWPTPLYASMQDGIAKVERMDMLLGDDLQVASWGKLNFNTDHLDLRFAIPGYSLRKVLQLDIVDNEDYLVIPVQGRFDNVKIRWDKVAAQVGALVAKAQAGHLVGALAKIALDAKVKVPPPTTQPFPWGQPPEGENPSSNIKKKALKELKKHLGI